MKVKICGLRRRADVDACVSAGVDAIGFNFWRKSPRQVTTAEVRDLVREIPPSIQRVGVFVNPRRDDVREVVDAGLIDVAQLHGDEDPAFCTAIGVAFWKAVRIGKDDDLERLRIYGGELIVIDAVSEAYGGSGKRIALDVARRAALMRPVMLAGGLTPDNVADAVREVVPFGVDVASGVESAPGEKDAAKVRAFVAAARGAR